MNTKHASAIAASAALFLSSIGTTGCAVEADGTSDEQATEAASDQLTSTKATALTVTFTCLDWDQACRRSLEKKLVAAKSRAPSKVLASMDQLASTQAFADAQDAPGPQPQTVCGTLWDVTICCTWNGGVSCHVIEPNRF